MKRIAILDDSRGAAPDAASWERLDTRASVDVCRDTVTNEDDLVARTPHLGYVTHETYRIFFRQVVENIAAYLDGRIPPRCINPEAAARRRPRPPA